MAVAIVHAKPEPTQPVVNNTLLSNVLSIGNNDFGGEVVNWCHNTSSILRQHKNDAQMFLYHGDYHTANETLLAGLRAALEAEVSDIGTTFGYKALTRGLILANRLGVGYPPETQKQKRIIHSWLSSYYKFVQMSIQDLDLYIHQPLMSCVDCARDINYLELQFVNYAVTQLKYLNMNFITATTNLNGVLPKGPAAYYLKAVEVFSQFVAADLNDSLWNYAFGCTVNDLNALSEKLQRYNGGETNLYISDRIAVNMVWTQVDKSIKRIEEQNCY